jgi:hypothetical protein
MTAIMEKLQAFRRPITQSDYDGLLEWFKLLSGFFLFVRPTNGEIALKHLPADEQNRFGAALIGGIGQLFMAHCMNLVKKTINEGKSVDPNDLYDMLQLILLDDDNTLFVTREKTFFCMKLTTISPSEYCVGLIVSLMCKHSCPLCFRRFPYWLLSYFWNSIGRRGAGLAETFTAGPHHPDNRRRSQKPHADEIG